MSAELYRERPTAVTGAVLWRRAASGPEPGRRRILPDGCLDLIWNGSRLCVAGPDSAARWHVDTPGAAYAGLRLAGGLGPAVLGIPAQELRDRTLDLEELWPARDAGELARRVAAAPGEALEAWVAARAAASRLDPLGPRVQAMAVAGARIESMAHRTGLTPRQLHRRCLDLFGYGPRRLARVLRLNRALAAAGDGVPLARVAAEFGYADQAHLSRDVRALAGTTPAALVRELRLGAG